MNDLQKEIKRVSNLVQYKNLDKSTIERIAQINLWKKQSKIVDKFDDKKDKKLAEELFDGYLKNYEFENFNDIKNIANLVYNEIILQKLQKEVQEILNDEKSKFPPEKQINAIQSLEKRIWELQERYGIIGIKDKDDLSALSESEAKFKLHILHNRHEYTFWGPIPCKDCGSTNIAPFLIRRRCNKENYEILKHPHFSGRFWYNKRAMELVKIGFLPKAIYAWIFSTTVRFVEWCLKNENLIVECDGIEEKEIEEYINSKPYLRKQEIPDNLKKMVGK